MKAKVIKTGEIVDVYHETQHGQITNIYKESVLVNGRMWTEDELDFCVKANDAPEKLYLLPNEFISYCRNCDEDIEYTRTDVFIEKAETYLKEQFAKDVSILAGGVVHINFETAINNFINYMKGK